MQPSPAFTPEITLSAATAIVVLALADGGFSDQSVGVAAAAVWLALAGLLLGGRLRLSALRGPLALGALLLAGLAAWTALSIGWAGDRGAAFGDLVRSLLYLGGFLLVGLAARRGTGPSWLAGIALGGAVVAVVAVLARLAGLGVDRDLALELPAAAERLSFPLGYWNALGYLMAMTLPALAWVAISARAPHSRAAAAATAPVVLALFLTSSRGALLAAAVGLVAVAISTRRRDRLSIAAVACVPAWTVVILLAALVRSELDPFAGVTVAGALIALALIVVTALIYLALGAARAPGRALRPRVGAHARPLIVTVLLAAVAVAVFAGPSSFIGDFRTERGGEEIASASDALVSGSGRSSFWGAALSAFGEDPARGTGAGGFESYWSANGEIAVPIRNAHSTPLEVLAELGAIGALLLLGFVAVVSIALLRTARACRKGERGLAGAFAGIALAGAVAVSLDWTWEVSAAAAPLLIALAAVCGSALVPAGDGREPLSPETDPKPELRRASEPLAAGLVVLAGLSAIWAGAVLALAAVQIDRSEERLSEGDLAGAAGAALAADRLTPWSAEPSLALARVEQAGSNLLAARRRAERAADLSPLDFRPWSLLAEIHADLGNVAQAGAYGQRALALGQP